MARMFSSAYGHYSGVAVAATPLTIAGFVYRTTSPGTPQDVITLSSSGTQYFSLQIDGSNQIRARARNSGDAGNATSTGTVTVNTMTHAAAVYYSTTSRAAFMNGANKGTDTTSVPDPAVSAMSIAEAIDGGFFTGRVAHGGIWNAALTDEDIWSLFIGYSPLLVKPGNLVAYWPLLGLADPEPDYCGRPLTLTGSPTVAVGPEVYYPTGVAT